jgi:hypothetical protein
MNHLYAVPVVQQRLRPDSPGNDFSIQFHGDTITLQA